MVAGMVAHRSLLLNAWPAPQKHKTTLMMV
jgi:hypothetical protein